MQMGIGIVGMDKMQSKDVIVMVMVMVIEFEYENIPGHHRA
jgi:hypothetical protein